MTRSLAAAFRPVPGGGTAWASWLGTESQGADGVYVESATRILVIAVGPAADAAEEGRFVQWALVAVAVEAESFEIAGERPSERAVEIRQRSMSRTWAPQLRQLEEAKATPMTANQTSLKPSRGFLLRSLLLSLLSLLLKRRRAWARTTMMRWFR